MAIRDSICSIEGCGKKAACRKMCAAHYWKWRTYGDPLKVVKPRSIGCAVEGCLRDHKSKGYCDLHYKRHWRHGSDTRFKAANGDILKWLEEHAAHSGDNCLTLPFGLNKNGHTYIAFDGASIPAHRAMCTIAHGKPPTPEHQTAHSCGKGHMGCVHPEHLRWATRVENEADKMIHGTRPLGEASHMAKLTEASVRLIRADNDRSHSEMARMFGVSPSAIYYVRARKTWAWMT